MADLEKGYTIQTINFQKVVVGDKLGEGDQGAVYCVDYGGKPKALIWYTGKKFKNPDKFYKILENKIKNGKPTGTFLWPEDITEKAGDAFGYIMDLRPPEYKDFTRILLGKERFASITAMCNASLQIVEGFRELHKKGYSYQDLYDGNFFINPTNGDTLFCDNDIVSATGQNLSIAGNPRYMAPEIVAKGKSPDTNTDLFSLAVVLFLLWIKNHPLEGKAAFPVSMTAELERKIYGENPVFIFDPNDDSNRPVQGLNKGAITNWPFLPAYLQEQFRKAFSKEALHEPNKRIIEQEWLRAIIRMRSEIYKCPCGEVYFADPANLNPCPSCKRQNKFVFYLKFERYNVAVHQRTKLYTCHTEKDNYDFKTLAGETVAKDNNFELKNISGKNWILTDGENTSSVIPNAVVILKKGITINFGNTQAEII